MRRELIPLCFLYTFDGPRLVPAGIPANVGALYTFQSVNNSGAILMTKDPVTKNFVYGDRPLRTWCKENSQRILTRWPDVKDRGVIVVTSTYTTAQADINAWEDKQKTISVGFRTGFVNVMEVAPSSDWYTASSDNGWITSKSPDVRNIRAWLETHTYTRTRMNLPKSSSLEACTSNTTD